jgi:hypothetical protein
MLLMTRARVVRGIDTGGAAHEASYGSEAANSHRRGELGNGSINWHVNHFAPRGVQVRGRTFLLLLCGLVRGSATSDGGYSS